MSDTFDIVVIGAGIAGASIAAELAPHARVLLAEAEDFPGYHTTGRSAAFWEECYGGPQIAPLTLASGEYLRDLGFLAPRGALYLAREGSEERVDAFISSFRGSGVTIERIGRDRMEEIVPGLQPGWTQAISEPACADIEVAGLHQHYLSMAARQGCKLRVRHRLQAIERDGDGWRLDFGQAGPVRAGIIVNAAGAWADELPQMAGVRGLGVQPYRRTVLQLRCTPAPPNDLPLVLDLDGKFYFKPDGNRLWLSPHDETPSEPCDAAPEELDVALAIDRMQGVVGWHVEAVERKWAGLRSFAPDRLPVYGFDPRLPGFFWFAGQGGFGIQTAPAAARLAAQLLLGQPRDAMTRDLDAARYAPDRLLHADMGQ